MRARRILALVTWATVGLAATGAAQDAGFGICQPVSDRTSEMGCWILSDVPLGRVNQSTIFWHLDTYPSRAAADRAKGRHGTVLEAQGKVWLMTIERAGWRPAIAGRHVADIGPLHVIAGKAYSALFMETVAMPGTVSSIHTHSGPEAWYTIAGVTCLETPQGKLVGLPGDKPVIVGGGSPMVLTTVGRTERRSLTLILYDVEQEPTTIEHTWKPKGLCKAPAGSQSPAAEPSPAAGQASPLTAAQKRAALRNPASAFWKAKAGDTVVADVETSRGAMTIELVRSWAPAGVDRFYNLARAGYFDDSRFFRVIDGFIAQFGIAGNGDIASLWATQHIAADSAREHNVRGTLSFAQYKPTDRTTNVFINLRDNPSLDTLGFAPIGHVVKGMEIADSLYAGYGEMPAADKPLGDPQKLYGESNKYLDATFPKLDRLLKVTIRTP